MKDWPQYLLLVWNSRAKRHTKRQRLGERAHKCEFVVGRVELGGYGSDSAAQLVCLMETTSASYRHGFVERRVT
jgi:hypothetical protein